MTTVPCPPCPPAAGDLASELVRHFLVECTPRGVRLKGCPNEPYFGEWRGGRWRPPVLWPREHFCPGAPSPRQRLRRTTHTGR